MDSGIKKNPTRDFYVGSTTGGAVFLENFPFQNGCVNTVPYGEISDFGMELNCEPIKLSFCS